MSVAFDHLMVMVADEAAAAREFLKAGFTVTPRSELPGMANRLVCFPSRAPYSACFLELLASERPDDVPPVIRSFVGPNLGPVAIVLAVSDMKALLRRLSQQQVATVGPLEIRRSWELQSHQSLDVALDVLLGDAASLPFRWAAVQHHTVSHYQRPDFVRHANGHQGLCAVVIAVDDPPLVGAKMETLFGCAAHRADEAVIVGLDNTRLLLVPRKHSHRHAASPDAEFLGVVMQPDAEVDLADIGRRFLTNPDGIRNAEKLGGLTLISL